MWCWKRAFTTDKHITTKAQQGQHVVIKGQTSSSVNKWTSKSTAKPACGAGRADLITGEHVDEVWQGWHEVMRPFIAGEYV